MIDRVDFIDEWMILTTVLLKCVMNDSSSFQVWFNRFQWGKEVLEIFWYMLGEFWRKTRGPKEKKKRFILEPVSGPLGRAITEFLLGFYCPFVCILFVVTRSERTAKNEFFLSSRNDFFFTPKILTTPPRPMSFNIWKPRLTKWFQFFSCWKEIFFFLLFISSVSF